MTNQHPDLPLEQQRNTEYLATLVRWLEKPISYGTTRNERWVNPNANGHGKSYGVLHPLIGRVGLTEPDEFLGTSFYIGARRFDGDTQTVSWLAPIARAFFQPDDPSHGLMGQIAAIRTFSCKLDQVVHIDEEWFSELPGGSPFTAPELKITAPLGHVAVRSGRRKLAAHGPAGISVHMPMPLPAAAKSGDAATSAAAASSTSGMRASSAVLSRLAVPRSKELVSVLATLQPDQHDLVTRPADQDLIVQGHPGTGKTIVAAYRAGYLITPRAPNRGEYGGGLKSVLLIGPTPGYVNHVSGLLRPFEGQGGGRATVIDLGTFMSRIVGIKSPWSGGLDGEPSDVDAGAFRLTKRAAEIVRGLPRGLGYRGRKDSVLHDLARTYWTLRNNGTDQNRISDPEVYPEDIRWMSKLPPFEEAIQLRRWLPLLAQCKMAQWPEAARGLFDHIIVDEAQDVSPIEWSILEQYQHPWKSHWTLVGDQNQRRSNVSYTTWQRVAGHINLNHGTVIEPALMSRGYRSTNAILKFADGVLGPSLRQAGSIQDGGEPVRIEREPKSKRIWRRALGIASEFSVKYGEGTVAIISAYPEQLAAEMATLGWRRPDPKDRRHWTLGNAQVRIFSPERARGLEFDAVVVVEPRQFNNDNGRHGQLYTSLTRANRELAVVYHQKLPGGLKTRA